MRCSSRSDRVPFPLVLGVLAAVLVGWTEQGGQAMAFELKSSAFEHDQTIPKKYTCDEMDVSVPLRWNDPPAGTKSFALIADDPDAPRGTWVHWVLYDLPVSARELAEGVPAQETLPTGAKQGVNDFKKVGYGGPCPPPGPAHRYFFTLYALDQPTGLRPRATKAQLLETMKDHVLAEAQLLGRYRR